MGVLWKSAHGLPSSLPNLDGSYPKKPLTVLVRLRRLRGYARLEAADNSRSEVGMDLAAGYVSYTVTRFRKGI
jgi:hypothetical protein